IQGHQGSSRADIAKALSISEPTASKMVDELLAEGWVRERESTLKNSLGGRKPFHLYFNCNAQFMIGVDIGGTTVEAALINLNGQIIGKMSFATQKYVSNHFIEKVKDTIFYLMKEQDI